MFLGIAIRNYPGIRSVENVELNKQAQNLRYDPLLFCDRSAPSSCGTAWLWIGLVGASYGGTQRVSLPSRSVLVQLHTAGFS